MLIYADGSALSRSVLGGVDGTDDLSGLAGLAGLDGFDEPADAGGTDGAERTRAVRTDAAALVVEVAAWRAWFAEHADDVITSPLGVTELRRAADPLGRAVRDLARDLAEQLTVVRFYDTALARASMMQSVLPPFAALHWGLATTQPDVEAIATYDPLLAQVAVLHGVTVVTPGRPAGWWAS